MLIGAGACQSVSVGHYSALADDSRKTSSGAHHFHEGDDSGGLWDEFLLIRKFGLSLN
jgi:hypothetical protein